MKKVFCILLIGIMLFSISGCSHSANSTPILSSTEPTNTPSTAPPPTTIPTIKPVVNPTPEPTSIPTAIKPPTNTTDLFETLETSDTTIIEEVYYYNSVYEPERIRDTFCIRFTGDDYEKQMVNYLAEHLVLNGFENLEPESVFYLRDGIKCEYYVYNDDLCFALFTNDLGQNNTGSLDIIIVRNAFLMKVGEIFYSYDQERDVHREAYYDIDRERKEAVEYYYRQGLSFPVISKHEYANSNPSEVYNLAYTLMRSERFAYQEYLFGYDDYGNIIEYQGCLGSKYGIENGCEPPCGLETGVTIEYENGVKSVVEHAFGTAWGHGSFDSAGTAYHDEYGRMVYRTHYVTSGGFTCFYLYENEASRPWACVAYGGMPQSGGDDYVYGQHTFIYLFK